MKRRQVKKPNGIARALRSSIFRHRVQRNRKAYTRKVKHKGRDQA